MNGMHKKEHMADMDAPQDYTTMQCRACGFHDFPGGGICPSCLSEDVAREQLPTQGVLYSFSSMPVGGEKVFVGYVDVHKQVRLFARLRGFSQAQPPRCDMRVSLADTARGAPGTPCFTFTAAKEAP